MFFQRKKEDFLVLDIGKEAIKALIIRKRGNEKEVEAFALEYFDDHKFLDLGETNIIRETISIIFKKPNFKNLPKKVTLGLSPSILKGRIISFVIRRKTPKRLIQKKEADLIQKEALAETQERIADFIFETSGILPKDIFFTSLEIIEVKIDGYLVPSLEGYSGEDISFKVLAIFSLKDYLIDIENIIKSFGFKEVKILHPAQGILKFKIVGLENSILIDIGGNDTQIFLIRNSKLEEIGDFGIGGKLFSHDLSEALGRTEREGRELKERYARGELSIQVKTRVEEILDKTKINWYKNLKEVIENLKPSGFFPSNFCLFGGGAQLPEIRKVLEEENWKGIDLIGDIQVQIFSPGDYCYYFNFRKEKLPPQILNNPQYTILFLIAYARENF